MEHDNIQPSNTIDSQLKVMHDADEALLARLGYKQGTGSIVSIPIFTHVANLEEFRRTFSPIEVFGIGFSIIGLVPSLA